MSNNGNNHTNKENNKELDYYIWIEKALDDLKQKNIKRHVVHGGWTPSGFFHIGNARAELMIPTFISKSLKDEGFEVKHNLIIDDFDDFDKIPKGIKVNEAEFEKHFGKCLRDVPSPVEGYANWADYFSKQVLSALDEFGVKPNILSSYDCYKQGLYDEAIKIVLNKAEEVRKIWNEVTSGDKPKGWYPIMVVCEKCGKISTTKVREWNGQEVEYLCTNHRNYAEGCRHKAWVRPEKGRAKLPWRLHWPATWFIHGVTFETAGKDHFAAGGSVESGRRFLKEIFGKEPPYQIPTEFLLVDDAKLSGSSGNVISLRDWLDFAEPELLRFMMASYKPQTVINFDLHSNKFFLLADRYDEAERIYFDKKEEKSKRERQLAEIYKYAQIREIPEKMPVQLNYNIATVIVQTFPEKPLGEIASIIHEKGWIARKTLTSQDKQRMEKRLQLAKNWLERYAPEDVKFVVQDKIPRGLQLSDRQREALHIVASRLNEKEWDQKELFNEFYIICQHLGLNNTDFFRAAYNVLLDKDRGPKLAPFILTLGKERVAALFGKA
ncbi:lysine--tRNA ligase [Candidatus Woesearchaeota archaeon]|nr:lysine--tRNA ligase [Candidatus Woesearchaeota archaeon]